VMRGRDAAAAEAAAKQQLGAAEKRCAAQLQAAQKVGVRCARSACGAAQAAASLLQLLVPGLQQLT
jgi:hypothetical protein